MVVAVVGLGCQLPVTRLWKQCFFEIAQFAQLGTGNFLCHCEHGYHRGPIAGGLVYCALHNSQPDRDAPVGMLWFLDELAKVQKTNTQNIKHKQNNLTKIKRSARSRMSARSVIFAPTPPRIAVWPACNVGLTSQSPRSLPSTLTSRALIPPTPLRLSARSIEGGGGGVDMRLSARSIAGGEGGEIRLPARLTNHVIVASAPSPTRSIVVAPPAAAPAVRAAQPQPLLLSRSTWTAQAALVSRRLPSRGMAGRSKHIYIIKITIPISLCYLICL